jgi:hypothetical protein
MLPLGAIAVAILLARRSAAAWFVLGGLVALLPQWLLNRWRGTLWTPVPERTGWLTELQATFAPFVVRYDTVVAPDAQPSLAFCSPSMAQALDGKTPSSPGELAVTYLTHMPQSLVVSVQKVGAGLHWPLSAPYLTPAPVVNSLFAVLVTAVSVIGAAALLRRSFGRGRRMTLGQVGLLLALAASVVGLVTSATETRFALSLVLLGIVGCAELIADGLRLPRTKAARCWVVGTLIVAVGLYVAGVAGMAYPWDGLVSLEVCAGF